MSPSELSYATQVKSIGTVQAFFYRCSLMAIYFLAIASIYPPIRALIFFNQLWAAILIGWIVFSFLSHPSFFLLPFKHTVAVYIYIIYTVSFAYLTGNGVIGNRFFELSQLPIFYIAYELNSLRGYAKNNRMIIAATAPFVLLTIYFTIEQYALHPFASRLIKATDIGKEYMTAGVGGYDFIYFLVIVSAILLHTAFEKNVALKFKVLGAAFLLIAAINVQLSNYSTALLLLIISFLARLFQLWPHSNTKSSLFLSFFGIVISFLLLSTYYLELTDYFIALLGDSLNATRVLEIQKYLSVGVMGDSIISRWDAYYQSIQVFVQNPFLGTLTTPLTYLPDGGVSGFGQHSQILDTFALYGLGIGVLQLYVYLQPVVSRLRNKNGSFSGLSFLIFILAVILFTVNGASPSIGFAFFFIYPTVYDWLQEMQSFNHPG